MQSHEYLTIRSIEEIEIYLGDATVVAFDFETSAKDEYRGEEYSALDAHKSDITGISLSVRAGTARYIPLRHRNGENADVEIIMSYLTTRLFKNRDIVKIAHNLAFESMFLYKYGIVIQEPVYDTIVAAQLTLKDEYTFRTLKDCGLKTLVPYLYQVELPTFAEVTQGRCFDELNPEDWDTCRYACADSDYALQIYDTINHWFDGNMPKHRYICEKVESPAAVYTGMMRYNGIPVDKETMLVRQGEAYNKVAQIKQKIDEITGGINIGDNASTQAFKDYLFKQMKLPVMKVTDKGKAAVDDEAIMLLHDFCQTKHPELVPLFDLILEYRKWSKLKTTYLDGYLDFINDATGRIHPDLMPMGTDTGRFACRKPNFQNCFDDQTEILTTRGFVLFKDLSGDDKVAEWDHGDVYFVKPSQNIKQDYAGKIVHISNEHIDLKMTPDHICLLQNRKNNKFYVVPASEYSKDAKQINAAQYMFGTKHLNADEILVLAATQADGYVRGNTIEFKFAKARKYYRLVTAVNNVGIPHNDRVCKNGEVSITLKDCDIVKEVLNLLGPEKCWGSWLLDFDRHTVKHILEELPEWDGCFTIGSMYSSSIKVNSDWMQILYVLMGIRTNQRQYHNGNPNSVTNYQLDITDRNFSLTSNCHIETEPYEGYVYCVSVPSGYVMIRRNGKVCVTGNCPQAGDDPLGIRNFITAPEGYSIMECDYSQAEIRLVAYLSGDRVLLDAYKCGVDVHALTTSAVFGISLAEAMDHSNPQYKHRRTVAKGTMFGIMYGIAGAGLSRNLYTNAGVKVTKQQCDDYIDGILNKYENMAKWQQQQKKLAYDQLYVETALGRRRYLPGIRSKVNSYRNGAERMAINTPVQGLGADCLKLSMGRLIKTLENKPYIQPILTVHDSLVFIIKDEYIDEAVLLLKACMEAPPPLKGFMPLIAEASVGKQYGRLEDV